MHYYIDGYNLLFRILRAGDDIQKQRNWIIQDLSHKIKALDIDASLIFDSQYQPGESTRNHFDNLEVSFTAEGETADEFILNEIKHSLNPRFETVVTSDKKLAWRARRKAAHSISVEEFVAWVNRRYKNKINESKKERKSKQNVLKPIPINAPAVANETNLSKEASALECLDYYERVFEKELSKILEESNSLQASLQTQSEGFSKKRKKAKLHRPSEVEKDGRSNMERWLEIFEKRLDTLSG